MTFIDPRLEWIQPLTQAQKNVQSKRITVATRFQSVKPLAGLVATHYHSKGARHIRGISCTSGIFKPVRSPMSLAAKIQKDLTDAMRAKDELRLSVLRMVKSAITYKETEKMRALDEPESIQLLQTLVKQRKESIEQFTKGGRKDLADKETKELAIIETYLPAGASEAEMDAAIAKAIAETGANSIKQMGAVVKAARAALEGKSVDGKALSDRVRARLA